MQTPDLTIAGVQLFDGPVGVMEVIVDAPRGPAHDGIAIVAHPQPLLGFSFGAFVQARVARVLQDRGRAAWRVCLAGMPSGPVDGGRVFDPPQGLADALVVHGERDERVALAAVLDWARPHGQPVVVVPGADHFFTGRLPVLRGLVLSHLAT